MKLAAPINGWKKIQTMDKEGDEMKGQNQDKPVKFPPRNDNEDRAELRAKMTNAEDSSRRNAEAIAPLSKEIARLKYESEERRQALESVSSELHALRHGGETAIRTDVVLRFEADLCDLIIEGDPDLESMQLHIHGFEIGDGDMSIGDLEILRNGLSDLIRAARKLYAERNKGESWKRIEDKPSGFPVPHKVVELEMGEAVRTSLVDHYPALRRNDVWGLVVLRNNGNDKGILEFGRTTHDALKSVRIAGAVAVRITRVEQTSDFPVYAVVGFNSEGEKIDVAKAKAEQAEAES